MKGFYISGDNGSYVELEDGRHADTVEGVTSEPVAAHIALNTLCKLVNDWVSIAEWQEWSNWLQEISDIRDHVAVNKP